MVDEYIPNKGDIVWINTATRTGDNPQERHTAIVISSATYNHYGFMLACPIVPKAKGYPFEIPLTVRQITGAILADHVKNHDWRAREAMFVARAPRRILLQTIEIITLLLAK